MKASISSTPACRQARAMPSASARERAAGFSVRTCFPAPAARTVAVGSKTSAGLNADLSLTYDGTLLPGWQVTPGLFVSRALAGRTPNIQGTWMKGATTANFYVNFSKNPGTWQFGLNYSVFRGGSSVFDQVLRDRDFVGGFVSFNF